jgi:hypothetical protein
MVALYISILGGCRASYRKRVPPSAVIAGLDPAIHRSSQEFLAKRMDARVKPGHDGWRMTQQY